MARPNQEAIETFISITGASEAIAGQKLEEHGGDLNAAVNAYFNAPANAFAPPIADQDEFMDVDDDPVEVEPWGPHPSHLSGPVLSTPFSLLDPNFRRSLFDPATDLVGPEPPFTRRGAVRHVSIDFKDSNEPSGPSGFGPVIEDVTDTSPLVGPDIRGTVTLDDDDDNDEVLGGSIALAGLQRDGFSRGGPLNQFGGPSAPRSDELQDNDIEEQMIRAAIEASKMEVEKSFQSQPFSVDSDVNDTGLEQREPRLEDPELAHAVSLSLKTAEKEKALRDQGQSIGESSKGTSESVVVEPSNAAATTTNGMLEPGSSFAHDDTEDLDEKPLVRHRSRRVSSGSVEFVAKDVDVIEDSPPLSPRPRSNTAASTESNGNAFHSEDWGGLSSLEHDEAVMLEAAMFGGIPEGTRYRFPYGPNQMVQSEGRYSWPTPRPPSPSLTAQRMIREQQDDEYLASLQADREKELKALEEAEARLEKERRKEEELRKKLEEEKELERLLAEKEATFPEEPSSDDEKAVNLLVRMPDGSRRGRRFLKSDNLQSLFDFIDIGRAVKPGSYRLIRTYPRRAFEEGESGLTFSELGLTSKQEALYLELK